jgi:EAL domain-containing protein (putative c-di-GMP-specific phosphodiesterase class I)
MMDRIQLDRLLGDDLLTLRFQPIFNIAGDSRFPWAAEALAHGPADTNFATSNVLFDYVRLKHAEIEVDRHCIAKALREAADIPAYLLISLNAHAVTIEKDRTFPEFLALATRRAGIDPSRVVIEIVEQSRYWNTTSMRRAVSEIRDIGMSVALDDIGCGFCNYQMIVDLQPQYLKIDRYFIHDCPQEGSRRAVLRSMQMLARDVGARVVAEGIETEQELTTVRSIGIDLAQGFALGHPVPAGRLTSELEPVYT